MGTGKIDKVYDEIIKMEERFMKLEREQQRHFEEHIEKAAASIIAKIKRKIEECKCNKEVIELLKSKDTGKQKVTDEQVIVQANKIKYSSGWHPENLKIEETPFCFKK